MTTSLNARPISTFLCLIYDGVVFNKIFIVYFFFNFRLFHNLWLNKGYSSTTNPNAGHLGKMLDNFFNEYLKVIKQKKTQKLPYRLILNKNYSNTMEVKTALWANKRLSYINCNQLLLLDMVIRRGCIDRTIKSCNFLGAKPNRKVEKVKKRKKRSL